MGVMKHIRRLAGGEPNADEAEPPSHVCASCGEEYFSPATKEIDTCRGCGGVKVERVRR